MEENKLIFALDIGTRSVVGVLVDETANGMELVAAEVEEHKNRAMLDGQIHDVEEVAKVVIQIKERLEKRMQVSLRGVAVAAAGRALKTIRASVARDVSLFKEITREDALSIELEAVQIAQNNLLETENTNTKYHCVGYSVVHRYLNNQKIGSLVGQQGEEIGVEVLATFLPRVVVDSLFAVLDRAGLEMTGLTLEPIAASQVVIPPSMRQLSLALVDVGAGTSDIAITSEGTIVAFAMVPEAGDEITEAICEHYLLDFNEGERVKRQLSLGESVELQDVLGVKHQVSTQEVIDQIAPRVAGLAQRISEKIINLAPKQIQAVLFIGGGALTPLLPQMVAEHMGLSPQRVGIRTREVVSDVIGDLANLDGPDAITPLGIAVIAQKGLGLNFRKVSVNNTLVRIFEINQGTAADALLAAGVSMKTLYGKPGLALTVTVNGEFEMIKGQHGKPAKILINGQLARLDTPIKSEDIISVETAEAGQDAKGIISDVAGDLQPLIFYVNNQEITIQPVVTMNGEVVDAITPLADGAEILVYRPQNVGQVLEMAGLDHYLTGNFVYKINGSLVSLNHHIGRLDRISIEPKPQIEAMESPVINQVNAGPASRPVSESATPLEAVNLEADEFAVFVNDEPLILKKKADNYLFVDLLNYVEVATRPPQAGAVLKMQINGLPADFTSVIKPEDQIILGWQVEEAKNGVRE